MINLHDLEENLKEKSIGDVEIDKKNTDTEDEKKEMGLGEEPNLESDKKPSVHLLFVEQECFH